MNQKSVMRNLLFVSLLGATVLAGSPAVTSAGQGKWWIPDRGGKNAPVPGARYSAPMWRGQGGYGRTVYVPGPRYARPWRGRTVYRDFVHVSLGPRYAYRPVAGWRYYVAPAYYEPRHIVYVRPVRFFLSAGLVLGHVGISAQYSNPGEIYGCNFCDARFDNYDDYVEHVQHCPYAPHGYIIQAQPWDQGDWSNRDWQDDRNWDRDNCQNRGDDRSDDRNGRYYDQNDRSYDRNDRSYDRDNGYYDRDNGYYDRRNRDDGDDPGDRDDDQSDDR